MRLIVFNSSLSLFSWLPTWVVVVYYKPVVFYAIIFILPLNQHSDDKPVPIRGSPAVIFSVVCVSPELVTAASLAQSLMRSHEPGVLTILHGWTSLPHLKWDAGSSLNGSPWVLEIHAEAHFHQAGGKYNISIDSIILTLC